MTRSIIFGAFVIQTPRPFPNEVPREEPRPPPARPPVRVPAAPPTVCPTEPRVPVAREAGFPST